MHGYFSNITAAKDLKPYAKVSSQQVLNQYEHWNKKRNKWV